MYCTLCRGSIRCMYCTLQGFYKVYGAVFCRIADEEEEYNMEEDGERLPQFGGCI